MVGFVTLGTGLVAVSLLKPRKYKPLPYSVVLNKSYITKNIKSVISIKVFNNYALVVLAIWFGLAMMGYTLVLFSISPYASLVGLSSHQGSVLTALLNVGQTFGRPGMGLIADRIGRFNVVAIVNLLITTFLFVWWITATTFLALAPFSLILGFLIGMASTFAQTLASDIISDRIHDLPAVWSGLNIFVSFFCLVAEVIALAVEDKNALKPFLYTQIFTGCCFFVTFVLCLIMREWMVRKMLKKRHQISLESLSILDSLELESIEFQNKLQKLNARIEHYNFMLRGGIIVYFCRMLYPIKV